MPDTKRAIFITGAASGIGLTTARLFASRGWFVGGFDVDAEGLKNLEDELGDNGMTGTLDVTDREAFQLAAEAFASKSGNRMDILFNNAGVGIGGGPFEYVQFQDLVKAVQINLIGVMAGIHVCANLLKATPNSLCFNTSSASAIFGMPYIAVYSATKAAVQALTEALSIEFAPYGVRVADALPGLVATRFISTIAESKHDGPFRVVPPDDVAEAVWSAYGADQVHWFVPIELKQLAVDAAANPAAVRKAIIERSGPFAWMEQMG